MHPPTHTHPRRAAASPCTISCQQQRSAPATLMLWVAAVVLGGAGLGAAQQQCTIASLSDAESVVATCCEGVDGGCADSFPATCSHSCAHLVVPYDDMCGEMLDAMGDGMFAFHVAAFANFTAACRQTLVLYERANGVGGDGCTGDALQSRVDAMNAACCEQNGVNTCTAGAPQTCDAECAVEFLTYWEQCLDERAAIGGDMHEFTELYTACTDHLPEEEKRALYDDVVSLDESPECLVNTSMIVSTRQAKVDSIVPVCEENAFGEMCGRSIELGLKTCEHDYCVFCEEAHSCDHECGFPCAGGHGDGRRIMAEATARGGADFRGFSSALAALTARCPLETFEARLQHVNGACCSGGACTADGLPEDCSYQCGRIWLDFARACEGLLAQLFGEAASYADFTDMCVDMDPVSMAVVISTARCEVCGDGMVVGHEQCDEGAANSQAPGAECRLNCERARCGDAVQDPGEECDFGPLNSDDHRAACSTTCEARYADEYYIGCYIDNSGERDLKGDGGEPGVGPETVEPGAGSVAECAALCEGYTYMGLQRANQCFCGNVFGAQGAVAATDCDTDGAVEDGGWADLCGNGERNCGNRNAIYSVEAVLEARSCRELRCGHGAVGVVDDRLLCEERPRCAELSEQHEVGCCADSEVEGYAHPCADRPVWGERDAHGMACNNGATYAEAVEFCRAMGGRLCTAEEMEAGCTAGTGCEHDWDLLWTSTRGGAQQPSDGGGH